VDPSWSWSFHFGPKKRTGPDFQALMATQGYGSSGCNHGCSCRCSHGVGGGTGPTTALIAQESAF
jgi:hypothetical protein